MLQPRTTDLRFVQTQTFSLDITRIPPPHSFLLLLFYTFFTSTLSHSVHCLTSNTFIFYCFSPNCCKLIFVFCISLFFIMMLKLTVFLLFYSLRVQKIISASGEYCPITLYSNFSLCVVFTAALTKEQTHLRPVIMNKATTDGSNSSSDIFINS